MTETAILSPIFINFFFPYFLVVRGSGWLYVSISTRPRLQRGWPKKRFYRPMLKN
jgi:hypothetical protein